MKKNNVDSILTKVLVVVLLGLVIYFAASVVKSEINESKEVDELIRKSEVLCTYCEISNDLGKDAADAYQEINDLWEDENHVGIGTYEFTYWGDTLRINAISVDGVMQYSGPVSK